jgi:NADH-quinone oxidoreductase subunit L
MDETVLGFAEMRYLWLVPALPLAVAALNLFVGTRLRRWAGVLGSAAVGLSFLLSLLFVFDLVQNDPEHRLIVRHVFDWISVGNFTVGADLRLDPLSAVMILVITGVGFLIHVYAIG